MKKKDIINLGKDLGLKNSDIEKVILKDTGLSKSQLFISDEINDKFKEQLLKKFNLLKTGYPLEYIIEKADFYSEEFYVNKNVLIPRHDTEIMVDKAIEEALNYKNITLIDVGTGSSCIPISIIKNSSRISNCYVIDISEHALKVSLKNIINHKLDGKIKQIHGNLLDKVIGSDDFKFNKNIFITANLPYIKSKDYENIDNETLKYEPSLALYGGDDTGFELYETLIQQIIKFKRINYISKITLFIEIGFDQKEHSQKYLSDLNLRFRYYKDNNGIYRCIKIEF